MNQNTIYRPGLGVVASHRRRIRPGNEYNRFFRKPLGTAQLLHPDGSVFQTLEFMKEKVHNTLVHTKALTDHFQSKSNNLQDFCQLTWDFLYNHIQYKEDDKGKEQLRSPNRSWADRRSGIDCDCYSIFGSTILTNAGVPHNIRIVKIDDKDYFQHVYTVIHVPTSSAKLTADSQRNEYYVIDPVLDKFNIEPGE